VGAFAVGTCDCGCYCLLAGASRGQKATAVKPRIYRVAAALLGELYFAFLRCPTGLPLGTLLALGFLEVRREFACHTFFGLVLLWAPLKPVTMAVAPAKPSSKTNKIPASTIRRLRSTLTLDGTISRSCNRSPTHNSGPVRELLKKVFTIKTTPTKLGRASITIEIALPMRRLPTMILTPIIFGFHYQCVQAGRATPIGTMGA
jgi:hypothetical protein